MSMLDISVDVHLARHGVPTSQGRMDDIVGWLNTLFRKRYGKQAGRGSRSDDVYSCPFSTEALARDAMGWVQFDLHDMRVTPRGHGAVLTGVIGVVP